MTRDIAQPQASSTDDTLLPHRRATAAFARTLLSGLESAGVEHVIASPGSRSTPLVLAAYRTPGLSTTVHHDERSAAFMALGAARTSGRAVALICTSGSAAANYLPAVVEAFHACVPLIVLTSDRPPELRAWGAGQTIDQHGIFGTHVRAFAELPVPTVGIDVEAIGWTEAQRAVATALGRPAGPVHLNLPFREPLEPPLDDDAAIAEANANGRGAQRRELQRRPAQPTDADFALLADTVRAHPEGVIACGPIGDEPGFREALVEFSALSGWPVLADPLSQLRSPERGNSRREAGAASICATSDLWLRDAKLRGELAPSAVLRIGASLTSKAFRLWLEAHPPSAHILVDPDALWNDPSRLVTGRIAADPAALLRGASELLRTTPGLASQPERTTFRRRFDNLEERTETLLETELKSASHFLEPELTSALCAHLPENALLYVASSMAIRNVDAFVARNAAPRHVLSNRGANGIDGTVSSALGAALVHDGPVVLLIGDLALLHDLGGLAVARRLGLSATIVVPNNDGGGIFAFLPIAERSARAGQSERFEALFHTPHGIDLSGCSAMFGVDFERTETRESFEAALARSIDAPGVQIIEVPIDCDANIERFRFLVRRAGEALEPC